VSFPNTPIKITLDFAGTVPVNTENCIAQEVTPNEIDPSGIIRLKFSVHNISNLAEVSKEVRIISEKDSKTTHE